MSDLRELLRTTAAEGGEAVDLAEDTVAARISRRRTRSRRFAVGATALAAAALVAGATWAVRPGDDQPPTTGGPGVVEAPPRIVQSNFSSTSGMEALQQTTLGVDANGCVRAASGRSAGTLVWPRGYTVRGTSESFEILDGSGKVVARSGVLLNIGGGGGVRVQDSWTGLDCVGNGAVWMVGEIDAAR
jgi:hypothetical protein